MLAVMEYISKRKNIIKPILRKWSCLFPHVRGVGKLLSSWSNSILQFSFANTARQFMKTFFHHSTVTAPNCNNVISCSNDKVCYNTEFYTEESL